MVVTTLSLAEEERRSCAQSPSNKGSGSSVMPGSQDAERLPQYWLTWDFLTACLLRPSNLRVKVVPVCLEAGRAVLSSFWGLLYMANI